VLLCCALVGLGRNAFVCKGTVQGGREHAWVMSREQDGVITFWETTTGAKYHLPHRWLGDMNGDKTKAMANTRWKKRGLNQKWDDPAAVAKRRDMSRKEHTQVMEDLVRLPIAPWPALCKQQNIVVVPYESIEVVFNGYQLWGNLCNHHPSCIYYDMEHDSRSWRPLVEESLLPKVSKEKKTVVSVGPAMSRFAAETLQYNIASEIKDNIRMIRMRQGLTTMFDEDDTLKETLELYLDFLEGEAQLDADWVYDSEGQLRKPWGCLSPFNSKTYVEQCKAAWAKYWKTRTNMDAQRIYLPVKENHILSGIPVHFSTDDVREIRKLILASKPLKEYFDIQSDDPSFFAFAKVFPMASMLASVWVFIGAELPLGEEAIRELMQAQYQQMLASGEGQEAAAPGVRASVPNKKAKE